MKIALTLLSLGLVALVYESGIWKSITGDFSEEKKPTKSDSKRPTTTNSGLPIATVERKSLYTDKYRVYFKKADGKFISPWHDVPLHAKGGHFNMLCEIPRWTNAKMEIATNEFLNPIKQDIKNGKVRFTHSAFPYIWNYGALPQTWEDPSHEDPETGSKGDNDPVDVLEIGSRVAKRGDVYPVKILGVLAMIDDGETDWKIIAIDINDPLAKEMHDIQDVERNMPGLLDATRNWLRNYKVPSGKPQNTFGYEGEFKNREFAHRVIEETHVFWKRLLAKEKTGDLNCRSAIYGEKDETMQEDAVAAVGPDPAVPPPASITKLVDSWDFLKN